ncbi:MAG: drug/metabolite transporter (DMT)-like permease [Gammaproteobacteria bacterium]|jgi:drug/metabolite transporter (DMT)-like permease
MKQSPNHDRPMLGIMLMILGMMVIPLLDIFAKKLAVDYPVLQITWARFAFNVIWLIPLLLLQREQSWRLPRHPWIQIFRGLCLLFSTFFFFLSIKTNPIPNALALLFVSPLIVTLLSPLILGEKFGLKRFVATLCGFCGVLIVLQPSSDAFQPTLLYALIAGFSYALYILATRKVSTSSSPLMTLFYTAMVGTLAISPWIPAIWVTPDSEAIFSFAAIGLIAATGHFLVILACQYAAASIVSPFNYTEIIGATLLSYLVFDYLPDLVAWLGIAIICASGIYISLREIKQQRVKPAALRR